jgi:hypothetical protein
MVLGVASGMTDAHITKYTPKHVLIVPHVPVMARSGKVLGHQLMAVTGPTFRVPLCTWRLMAFFFDS